MTAIASVAGQSELVRIAGHLAAINSEIERLLGLGLVPERKAADRLGRALDEMWAMSQLLAETRAEVVGLAPPSSDLGDVLDAVVVETEKAAFEILRQAERAQTAAGRLHAGTSADPQHDLDEVNDAATAIVLACGFQDITGQRVRKVLSTMRQIEARVTALVDLMGIKPEETRARQAATAPGGEASLLNGPSSAAEGGLGQSAVDDLFG
ncbi:protein phosphatase CheZ [Roseomonas sp. E05]|uniref:protein phosphatase CheZ n=1 Tax=Roseomonas sp. E05 TaxID=3046310 RepID=UPI0024BA627A|nr:protein phosphatase CheZ [Roseomonas sp. E05]MDJ0390393.1 protein phosphatase CheZ [Roseomonas sp. E05]